VHDYEANRFYDITAENQHVMNVTEWDVSDESGHIHNEDCFEHEEIAEGEQTDSQPTKAPATASNPAVIDILVLYPTETANAMSSSSSEAIRTGKIELIIEQTNDIFINSNIYVTFRLAGHEINDVIPRNASSSGEVRDASGVSALREKYGADIVSHWNYDGSAGSGYVGSPSAARNIGFNTSKYSAVISQYTFAHECGHNLGARHDRYEYLNSKDTTILLTAPGYQFGKCFLTYRTVMAYDNSKHLPGAQNVNRKRIPHYSNPDVLYEGVPTGIAGTTPSTVGDGGPANVALRINECAKNAENWMPAKFTLTVNDGSGSGRYKVGTQVPIEANPLNSSYVFNQWTGDISGVADVHAASTFYTMQNTHATVTATYDILNALPNIANNRLSVYSEDSNLIIESDAVVQSVSVYNPTGIKVYAASPNNSTKVQISNVPKGIFLVKVVWQSGKTETRKVVGK
jgi:hypothetical protein